MGFAESKSPNLEKVVSEGEVYNIKFGICEMQGWRANMEDATIAENDESTKSMLFGVLDGHGGNKVSSFVAKFFSNVMKRLPSYENGKYDQALIETFIYLDELLKTEKINNLLKHDHIQKLSQTNIKQFKHSFENESIFSLDNHYISFDLKSRSNSPTDKDGSPYLLTCHESKRTFKNKENIIKDQKIHILKELPIVKKVKSFSFYSPVIKKLSEKKKSNEINFENLVAHKMGTTAILVYVRNRVFYTANLGDSRAVLYKGGKAIRLNNEHKPFLKSEQSRINKSGFQLISDRINGKLNLTRAIGDFMFKNNKNLKCHEQAVTVYPEVNMMKITKDMEFIVLACDGVWDCIDEDRLCEYVWKCLKEDMSISKIISSLFDMLISKTPKCKYINYKARTGTDNMSCIIIKLTQE